MESESPSPNLGLIGRDLTERSSTDIFAKLLGHEMRISSPIWIPESWKNKIVDEMRDKFQRAFPGIDFSRVASKELDHIGFQTVFTETRENSEEKHERPGIALMESMTQIIATYAYLIKNRTPVHYGDLRNSGFGYFGSANVDRITKSLVDTVRMDFQHHPDKLPLTVGRSEDLYTDATVQTIARAYFFGNFDELRRIFSESGKESFDTLLALTVADPVAGERRQLLTKKSREINTSTVGIYMEDKTDGNDSAIVYNMAANLYTGIMKPVADAVTQLAPKRLLLRFADREDKVKVRDAGKAFGLFIRSMEVHEFAHFLLPTLAQTAAR